MLHASETWPLTKTNLQRLQRNDWAMIRQICSIKPEDVATVRSSELLAKLELEDLDLERSSGAIKTVCDIQIDDRRGAGRPKLTWKKLTERLPFCLFDLVLYVPSTIFQLNRDVSSWVEPVLS